MKEKPQSHLAGLRTVALFEAAKGLLVLVVAFGIFSLVHRDVGEFAELLVRHLHLNPSGRLPEVFIHAAQKVTDARVWLLAFLALTYSAVRFIEAYGLWHARNWAEWFALLSGAFYIPWEIYELVRRATPIHWGLLLVNIGIVLYMLYVRVLTYQEAAAARAEEPHS